jgi:hypothetical protein
MPIPIGIPATINNGQSYQRTFIADALLLSIARGHAEPHDVLVDMCRAFAVAVRFQIAVAADRRRALVL